jgi:uncharacterized protein
MSLKMKLLNGKRVTYMLIEKTKAYVKSILEKDASGHDWWHIHRVHKLAKHLAEKEGANVLVVELAALLHDISDWKMNGGDDELGPKLAFEWLTENKVAKEIAEHVASIIRTMSFKGAQVKDAMATLEGKIVQDADRLDAIGAIGIARTFAYGGHKGRLMYHPEQKPEMHASFEDYKKNQSHTINHFYEKLLLLKDRMNTHTAKKIAEKRHELMEKYLADFLNEWDF